MAPRMATKGYYVMVVVGMIAALAGSSCGAGTGLECEQLPVDLCALSVSSAAYRCVLEVTARATGDVEYECQTSGVRAQAFAEWVETESCLRECGVGERMQTVGLSSDALTDPRFTASLCSDACQSACPNVVDLYTSLAQGEGVSLPQLCAALQIPTSRREMLGAVSLASLSANTVPAAYAPPPSHY